MQTTCEQCNEAPCRPYSGKGPRPTMCAACLYARRQARERAYNKSRPSTATVRERPPCTDCAAPMPPVMGKGRHSARCAACAAARRTQSLQEFRARSATARTCCDCAAELPGGTHGNVRRCVRCRANHKAARAQTRANSEGYVMRRAPGHPAASKDGLVLEHRLVVEARIGRVLAPEETVHHVNGQRDDNRDSNLELWSSRHPKGQRVDDKVAWALELLALYAPERLVS